MIKREKKTREREIEKGRQTDRHKNNETYHEIITATKDKDLSRNSTKREREKKNEKST